MRRSFVPFAGSALLFLTATATPLFSQTADSATGFTNSNFEIKYNAGAIVSLKKPGDTVDYLNNNRWGDVTIRYRQGSNDWKGVQTAQISESAVVSTSPDGSKYTADY